MISRFQSLQGRLLLFLGGVLFATLLIIGITVFVLVSSAERDLWLGRQFEAARNAAVQTRNYIDRARLGVQFIGQIDSASPQLAGILQAAIARDTSYLELLVVNAQGQVVAAAAAGETVLANVFTLAQSNWFVSTLGGEEDRLFLGDVQISPQNEPYIIIASPTRYGDVVALRLSLNVLGEVVSDLRFGETGLTYVAQARGIIAAHPDPAVVQGVISLAGRYELQAALDSPTGSATGSYLNFRGQAVTGTSSRIPDSNLVVITEVTQAEATANSRHALLLLGGITGLFWLGAMALTSTAVRRLVFVPITRLQAGAQEVERGNLQYQVAVMRADEIGQLTTSFNTMARSLHLRASEREQLIQDLQTAKRIAEENSRLKSEFLATMSHELRTPMNAIEGFTSIMLERMGDVEFNENAERYIRRVSVNSKRLLQLINDFLDLSRVESGRLQLAYQPFSPAALARRWHTEIGVLADQKQIGFDLTLDPHLPETLYGDEEAISKVILNLLSNAIKFTDEGQVSLSLVKDSDTWRITVKDTGIGIPPHAREYIFEEFRQVDQSSKRIYGGTGLGLSIVQKYTRTMGGTVTLQSEVGVGSTFTITLPLHTHTQLTEALSS